MTVSTDRGDTPPTLSARPGEPLPEFVHQAIPTNRLHDAITALRRAEEATNPHDKALYLKRADECILFARRSAESVMASWKVYNERARSLGAWVAAQEAAAREG